jgi:hypothetical protein
MNLKIWLKIHNIPLQVFAKKIGKNKSLVHKYIYEGVIPRHDVIVKIFRVTLGAVTANDFHKLCNDALEKEINAKINGRELNKNSFRY